MYRFAAIFLLIIISACHKPHGPSAADKLLSSPQKPLAISGNAYFFGDSITEGTFDGNWVSLVCAFTGMAGHNFAIGGTTMVKYTDIEVSGSMYSRAKAEIPLKKAGDKYLFFAYGINDIRLNYPAVTVAQFASDYQYVLDVALSYGWRPEDIVLINIYYIPLDGYFHSALQPNADRARHNSFNSAIYNLSIKNGTRYIDIFSFMQNYGDDDLISADAIHPNGTGYAVIARGIEEALRDFQ